MNRVRFLAVLSCLLAGSLLAGAACKSDSPPAAPASAPAAPVAPAPPAGSGDMKLEATLGAQLAKEAQSRPTGTPRAEDVLAALAVAGIKVPAPKQFLGATVGATYCFGGSAESGLGVSVCEYPDEDAAKSGRELSLTKFKALPNRVILVNKKTTLTLVSPGPSESNPDIAKASDAFGKL